MSSRSAELERIVDAIRRRQRFVISSHSRPDGDSIGSQLAMAFALRSLGKHAHVVNADPAPAPLLQFPGVAAIEIAAAVSGERRRDHHGVRGSGAHRRVRLTTITSSTSITIPATPARPPKVRSSVAACGDGARSDRRPRRAAALEVATHIYLAILTDTGSFH
jgi:phosphoesterase RecJ-like protein